MDGVQRPQFLKSIPLAFVKHITDDNHGKATIFSLGKFWHVKIQADGEELFFGDGWDELVSALELNEGFSLVFRYEGNMVFTIKVFDKSEEGLAYKSFFGSIYRHKERNPIQQNNNQKQLEVFLSGKPCILNINQIALIDAFMKRSVPVSFCSANGFSTSQTVILTDSEGKTFTVYLSCPSRSPKFHKGWSVFSGEKNLQEGDTCVFELDSENKNIMHVQINKKQNS
ncbi:B3 DNA binding domain-containing protein [Dioscorea alata]|uniref:B3 DNA binding domain-containing protein n=1 Tax=Dioscorea alata TaxID=55571 RepID=A0ACB7UBJ6_DIOAL|nr:B3 DNA binding domain-containing protein [Dioscorea alata]